VVDWERNQANLSTPSDKHHGIFKGKAAARQKAKMCEIAAHVDNGTYEGAGFEFSADTFSCSQFQTAVDDTTWIIQERRQIITICGLILIYYHNILW